MEQLLIQATLLRAKRLARRLQDAQAGNDESHQKLFSNFPKNSSRFSCSSSASSPFQSLPFEKNNEKQFLAEAGLQSNLKGKLINFKH